MSCFKLDKISESISTIRTLIRRSFKVRSSTRLPRGNKNTGFALVLRALDLRRNIRSSDLRFVLPCCVRAVAKRPVLSVVA